MDRNFKWRMKTTRQMAGVAGLEPVTSAVTGQRSNQLSYTPTMGTVKLEEADGSVKFCFGICSLKIRAADAKEVGVGNPAEETCCYPNEINVTFRQLFVNKLSLTSQCFRPCASLGWTRAFFSIEFRRGWTGIYRFVSQSRSR
jgi:hypothetical protein